MSLLDNKAIPLELVYTVSMMSWTLAQDENGMFHMEGIDENGIKWWMYWFPRSFRDIDDLASINIWSEAEVEHANTNEMEPNPYWFMDFEDGHVIETMDQEAFDLRSMVLVEWITGEILKKGTGRDGGDVRKLYEKEIGDE